MVAMNPQRTDRLRVREALATVHGNDIADLCMDMMQTIDLSHLATREDIHLLRTEIAQLRHDSGTANTQLRNGTDTSFTELRNDMNAGFTELRTDMDTRITELRNDMNAGFTTLRTDMDTRITELRTDMDTKFAALRNDMNAGFEQLRHEFAQHAAANQAWMVDRINISQRWNIGMVVSVMGVIMAASKLL